MLIFYVITSVWEAAALANAAGIIGSSSPGSMSINSNGKFMPAVYMIIIPFFNCDEIVNLNSGPFG